MILETLRLLVVGFFYVQMPKNSACVRTVNLVWQLYYMPTNIPSGVQVKKFTSPPICFNNILTKYICNIILLIVYLYSKLKNNDTRIKISRFGH